MFGFIFVKIVCRLKAEVDMFRYLWGRGAGGPASEREKTQKELFAFSRNVQFGFPHKAAADFLGFLGI